jgi:hypothetical protein
MIKKLIREWMTQSNLSWANLYRANLSGANLSRANLRGANLSGADLSEANLRGANLRGANLRGADLSGAYLSGANLRGADLGGAHLSGADLSGASLRRANLSGADLRLTCLDSANIPAPSENQEILYAGLEVSSDGFVVTGYRTITSVHVSDTRYEPSPDPYCAHVFSTDPSTDCHPGIYLASRDWIMRAYPNRPIVRCHCLRAELVHAHDKWRCKRLWIDEVVS